MTGSRHTALCASVPPAAALWLFRYVGGSKPGSGMLAAAARYERAGDLHTAQQLRQACAQLQAAAEQLPRIGSAEVAVSEMGAGSEVASPPQESLTVAVAAGLLGVSDRQVINLIGSGALDAAQRSQGRRWQVDRQSVMDLVQARRAR